MGGLPHGIGQVRFTNIGWTFGVAAGGDSGQLNRGEFFQLPPHRYWNNSNTVVMVNALSVPFFMGKNKYLKYLNDLSRGRYFLWSEELDTRSSDSTLLPLLNSLWVVGAVSSLFCHSTTDNISFNLNLAFWTTLHSGPFAANLSRWPPQNTARRFYSVQMPTCATT